MAQGQVTITLPISAHALGAIEVFALVILLTVLVFVLTRRNEGKVWVTQIQKKAGLSGLHPMLIAFIAVLWTLLFVALLAGIFWVLYGALELSVAVTPNQGGELRWYLLTLTAITATLGAVISFPFTLIRIHLNREQTETAKQGLITDRINTAVAGLGADKTVKRQRLDDSGNPAFVMINDKPDVSQPIMEEVTKPNLEVRIGSIYALERIAQDSDRDRVQIMEIVCSYIHQNSGRENVPSPPAEPSRNEWIQWMGSGPKHPRVDVVTALKVISRRTENHRHHEMQKGYQLDLARVRLRKLYLMNLNLSGADLRGARLDGADLAGAQLQRANLKYASLQGANLSEAHLQGANLRYMYINEYTKFGDADMSGAALTDLDLTGSSSLHPHLQIHSHLQNVFGDGTVTLPQEVQAPTHWPKHVLQDDEFEVEWHKWLDDPEGYTPPEE
jgi:hypothetical protein